MSKKSLFKFLNFQIYVLPSLGECTKQTGKLKVESSTVNVSLIA